jgi:hypothetical protein
LSQLVKQDKAHAVERNLKMSFREQRRREMRHIESSGMRFVLKETAEAAKSWFARKNLALSAIRPSAELFTAASQ